MSEEKSLFDPSAIDEKSKIIFRRSAGKMINDCPSAMPVFYRILPSNISEWDENKFFFAICLSCLYEDHGRAIPFETMLKMSLNDEDSREAMERRIDSMMTADWNDKDGILALKMMRILKVLEKKLPDVKPDFDKLYKDLKNWNHPDHYVQRSWARSIYYNPEKKEEN